MALRCQLGAVGGDGRGCDGDAAFTFLRHPVRHCGAIIHTSDTMGFAGIKQNPLGSRSFTGVDMGNNADITHEFEREFPCHDSKHT